VQSLIVVDFRQPISLWRNYRQQYTRWHNSWQILTTGTVFMRQCVCGLYRSQNRSNGANEIFLTMTQRVIESPPIQHIDATRRHLMSTQSVARWRSSIVCQQQTVWYRQNSHRFLAAVHRKSVDLFADDASTSEFKSRHDVAKILIEYRDIDTTFRM